MFSVEIRINSVLIGHVYGHNKADRNQDGDLYEWRYYRLEKPYLTEGEIRHHREDGIDALVCAILRASK